MKKRLITDFLFARPSFAAGAARVIDLWGTFDQYNESQSAEEADYEALLSDWSMVGQDISDSMEELDLELSSK